MATPDVSFIVYADLHVDIMHDAAARMQVMLCEAERYHVDFILHLGDIMYPDADFLAEHAPESLALREKTAWFVCDRDDEKHRIRAMIQENGIESFGVLGNHDMDSCTKATACRYFGMPAPYYSFDRGGIRFIALDTNLIRDGDTLIDFAHCNYRDSKRADTNWIDPAQLQWLEAQVMTSPYPCVLLSHAAIGDSQLNIHNAEDVFAIIRRANADKRRIILAMNGHVHIDGVCAREGVPFFDVNSMSNLWIGHKYDTVRYSETIHRAYPHLCGTAPYWDALFARVTINSEGIHIVGRESSFVGPSPQALGVPAEATFHAPSASIASRVLSLDEMRG